MAQVGMGCRVCMVRVSLEGVAGMDDEACRWRVSWASVE